MTENRGRKPIDISKEEIVEAIKSTKTQGQAADLLGISVPTFLKLRDEQGIIPRLIRKTPSISSFETPKFNYLQLKDFLFDLQENEEPTVGYNEVDIEIETDEPIPIIPTADWHIGARWVDYKRLIELVDTIMDHPKVFTLLNGDYCDNYNQLSYRGGQLEEAIPIQIQKSLAETLIKRLAPRILTILNGCHDEWSYFNDGFDFGKYLADKGECYYLGHNGYINLKVGDAEYRLFVTHNTYRNSTINDGHGLRSALREHGDFDIGICAHCHKPHVETFSLKGEKKWIMCCGGFKGQDRHVSKGGFPPVLKCTPGFILDNKVKEVTMNIDYRQLVKYF